MKATSCSSFWSCSFHDDDCPDRGGSTADATDQARPRDRVIDRGDQYSAPSSAFIESSAATLDASSTSRIQYAPLFAQALHGPDYGRAVAAVTLRRDPNDRRRRNRHPGGGSWTGGNNFSPDAQAGAQSGSLFNLNFGALPAAGRPQLRSSGSHSRGTSFRLLQARLTTGTTELGTGRKAPAERIACPEWRRGRGQTATAAPGQTTSSSSSLFSSPASSASLARRVTTRLSEWPA